MICRIICRKNSSTFSHWWRCLHSATNPPSMRAGIAAEMPSFGSDYLSREEHTIFTNPKRMFCFMSHKGRTSLSIPFGVKGCYYTTQSIVDLPSGGVVDVPLAQTGEGIAECELLKWFVKEGDQVEEFQPLCEVQSDKATIEITSRYQGKVLKTLHVPGDIVKVGETLLKVAVNIDSASNQSFEASEVIKIPDSSASESDVADSGIGKTNVGGVLSTPAVRNFAKQLGISIEDVFGTGKGGRVLKEDCLNYASQAGILKENSSSSNASLAEQYLEEEKSFPEVPSNYQWEFEDKTVPLRGFQRAMAKTMTLAARIPHFYYVEEINCTSLLELKASFQNENSDPGVKYTFLPVLIKSLSMALHKYPLMNSSFNEELQEVILKGSHNIGVAMATPHGLVVPNIKKVQSRSIMEITKELSRLQQLAKANKLTSEDITGGTITLSNIGAIGGKFGSPLINAPEVSIIAMGRIQTVPQFDEDQNVYSASVMTVNIGSDHRVLDGATVAKFCNEWKLFIEKPELLTLHMR